MFSRTQKNVKPQLFVVLTIRNCNEKKDIPKGYETFFHLKTKSNISNVPRMDELSHNLHK